MCLADTDWTHKEKSRVYRRVFRNKFAAEVMSKVLRVILGVIILERAIAKAQRYTSSRKQLITSVWTTLRTGASALAWNYLDSCAKTNRTNGRLIHSA